MAAPKKEFSFRPVDVHEGQEIPVPTGPFTAGHESDPEQAAEELISYLPEDTQMLIREAMHSKAAPLWQMLLGYTMRVADRSELFSPYILSSWEAGKKPNEARPCKTC